MTPQELVQHVRPERAPLSFDGLRMSGALCVLLVSVLAAACRAPAPTTRRIRVGYAGEVDFGDLPSLIAHERLRTAGYTIEPTFFSASDVAVAALADGSVDMIHASIISAWTAVSRGAHLRTVMDHVANPYRLVAAPGITTCAEIDGRRLALPSEGSVSTHLIRAYLAEECPAAKPDVMRLAESSSRAAAFLAGRVDAGGLELSSLLWLQAQAPGRFTVLSDFSKRWPNIRTTGVHVNTDFAQQHGDAVRDYLRAVLAANRDAMADANLLIKAANEKMGRAEDWSAAARAYIAADAWPQQGGFTRRDVETTLAFFQEHSRLDKSLTVDSVANVSFLEEVLSAK